MDREAVTRRSPLRVFERSIHGGLGRGNIGVVMSRAGIGRTAFLVGVGLDALLRERQVLHIHTRTSADRVREYYEEVFYELAESTKMVDRMHTHVQIERNRMIHSFLDQNFSLRRVNEALGYMSRHMSFEPSVILLEGYPEWESVSDAEMLELKELAERLQAEVWLEAQVRREGEDLDARGVPPRIARFDDLLSVMLRLQPSEEHVRLQLVKDHGNGELADIHIELDPRTLLMVWR